MALKEYDESSVEIAYETVAPEVEKQVKFAIKNARNIGCAFIMLRRSNVGIQGFSIKHVLWHEVDEVLREIGARGPGK